MSSALRELFVTILLFCMPSNPQELFNKHYLDWADDFIFEAQKNEVVLNESQIRTMVLIDIQERLHSWDRELKHFRIAEPTKEEMEAISFSTTSSLPVLIKEELEFDIKALIELVEDRKNKFTGSTGIAANLLLLGRTFHSRFKVPLNIDKDSVCNINAQTNLAELICKSKIIVWDEAPMGHRFQLEALDRSLRDITGIDKAFGDKSIVLSGDFRQCLPVIPNANRAEIVDASLNRSYLWQFIKVMQLTENMRVKLSRDPEAIAFDDFSLKLGNGDIETIEGTNLVQIPEEMCMEIVPNTRAIPNGEKDSMKKLAEFVYPNLKESFNMKGWMNGRAILAPTNSQVNQINDMLTDMLPGVPVVLSSSDDLINPNDFQRYNTEYLNTLSPNGLPNHRLFLKLGMPLMLMRNLNPKMGLCNGTRLIFNKVLNKHLLECTIVGGEHKDRKVLIPRITLKPKDREYPFEWCRRQFPVRVAFAMTINKSQGQTLSNVGVWLNDPCFGHGQLYVCISRVGSPKDIKFAIRKLDGQLWNITSNVVYDEVLLKGIA
jgi:ATP-dependent DNA helicase PIF1